jgi:hypothetical protein
MKDPVLCSCSHTFCRQCITKHLDRFETCPTCREPLSKENLLPNRSLCSLIEDEESHFLYYEFSDEDEGKGKKRKVKDTVESCEWIGKLKDLEAYYNQCQFVQTNCPHDGCDDIFVRKDLHGHIDNCIHQLSPCKWCNLGQNTALLDVHLLTCCEHFIPCPNGCLTHLQMVAIEPCVRWK